MEVVPSLPSTRHLPFGVGGSVSRRSRHRSTPWKVRAQPVRRIQLLVSARSSTPVSIAERFQSPSASRRASTACSSATLRCRRGEKSMFAGASCANRPPLQSTIQNLPLLSASNTEVSTHREPHHHVIRYERHLGHALSSCDAPLASGWSIDSRRGCDDDPCGL